MTVIALVLAVVGLGPVRVLLAEHPAARLATQAALGLVIARLSWVAVFTAANPI